jgi:hypothetical protein
MRSSKISTVILALSFLAGCSEKAGPPPPDPPQKTVFDPLTQQLDKARGVQDAVDANTDATRQAVDSQERGNSSN